jgi:His-Xaa-Ser system radical SAM maturase HxsC
MLRKYACVANSAGANAELSRKGLPTIASNKYDDFDVVELQPNGKYHRIFAVSSRDNALVTTTNCNSNCIMCPSPENTRVTNSIASISSLIDLINCIPDDTEHLTITGGEPTLLKDDFFTLMDVLNKKLPHTQLLYLTNGRAFCDKNYAFLYVKLASAITTVAVPIHASCDVLHDRITQSSGSFEQTIIGLKRIAKTKGDIEIRVVVSRLNIHDLMATTEFIIGNVPKATYINYIALEMSGNAYKNRDTVWIDYRDAFRAIKPCVIKAIKSGVDVNLYNFPLCSVDKSYWKIARQSISDHKISFAEGCEKCAEKSRCGGQFAATALGKYFEVTPYA